LNGLKGPIGPLGITDEKGSYSLSRRLIGPIKKLLDCVHYDIYSGSWMGVREKVILTKLYNGMVSTQEVAEHRNSKNYYLDPWSDRKRCKCKLIDFTRADHRLLPLSDPVFLRDRKGEIVQDAQTVVTVNWYVLTLTRSGDLYFNHEHYMENVQSIVLANSFRFILKLGKEHKHVYHRNPRLIEYLKGQDDRGLADDAKELRKHGEDIGFRPVTPSVADETYLANSIWDLCLRSDGRIEAPDLFSSISKELLERLAVESNYVESLVASSHHFAALLRLDDGSQEVYIWGDHYAHETADNKNPNLHLFFQKTNPEDGKSERKRIVNIVASHEDHDFFLSEGYPTEAFAVNFEDNTSCLLSWKGWFLGSLAEHVRSIYGTVDGILIVTDSGNLKVVHDLLGDFQGEWYLEELKIVDIKPRPVSFVVASDGYVLLYPNGASEISKSAQPPPEIRKRIRRAGGIAEIYHDVNGSFHAILRNGTIATWYTEIAKEHRNLSLSSS
jgi:hypothetical protein